MNHSGIPAKSRKNRNTNRQSTRLSQRQRILIGAAISTFLIVLIVVFYQTFHSTEAKGAVSGDYRTKASGNWASAATWQTFNGTTWVNAGSAPTTTAQTINILSGHTVTVAASVSSDQVVIDAGGTLNVSSGVTWTINNATTAIDLTNNGTLANSGTITINAGAAYSNAASSTYRHSQNGGTIPTASWASNSTCEITGVSTTMPSGINQNFGNLTWNNSGQTTSLGLNANMSIQGNFTMQNSGSSRLQLTDVLFSNRTFSIGGNYVGTGGEFRLSQSTGTGTMNVSGNCILSGGILMGNNSLASTTTTINGNLSMSGTSSLIIVSSSANSTVNVLGNLSFTGGTITMTESSGTGTLKVSGDFSHTGGTISETATGTVSGEIIFNGTAMQTYTSGGTVSNSINFTINNAAYLQMAAEATTITGAGTFTLANGGKLGIKATGGISSTGATGNIRVTGTRTFNTGADYIYNGTSAQITGSGLPATARDLQFDNTAGITITNSSAATGTLSLTNGIITTNTKELILGSGAVATLSRTNGYVIGNFKRWIAASTATGLEFPVGCAGYYNGITLDFTTAPSAAGYIISTFTTGYPDNYGLPLNDNAEECTTYGSGWWTLTPGNTFAGGTYSASARAEGFTGVNNFTLLHLMYRPHGGSPWVMNGTHASPTGTSSVPFVNRTGMTLLGDLGITSTGANPLPVTLISFNVKENKGTANITWATASESNSSYFMVQRSSNGKDYTNLARVSAAGNSNVIKNYSANDPNPLPGTSYYRLHQVDINGASENFPAKSFSLKTKETIKSFSTYPNPFKADMSMTFESLVAENMTMNIYTPQGVLVYSSVISVEKGKNAIELPALNKLMAGTYFITLGEGETKVKQTIVKL
ncbi:MAG TPA: T9SS type A sorting domain-containing protein [Bacteroidia bacterium]|nr:T9SS type A sorting domain-containing protein [Bacteroidia bacterium]